MKKRKIAFCFFLSFIIILNYALINLVMWSIDNKKNALLEDKILDSTNIEETNNQEDEIYNAPTDDENNPYWDYIKMNLINVDFKELKKENKDVVGWIQVNGTNINYPFVQTNNNSYYLTHSIDKKYTDAGWVFLDYRNDLNTDIKNMILYAHARKNTTMFGSLKNILKNNWYNDINNHVIKLSTEKENTLWQVFSIYKIPTTNDYIQTDFISDYEYNEFLQMIKNRSQFKFNTNLNANDRIITLSTCYTNDQKVVLHAKLIKREKRDLSNQE
ncbi:MAG: class B sortase [Bacilli bacterium]|nr:class B sortase [Bacilli bacterium]